MLLALCGQCLARCRAQPRRLSLIAARYRSSGGGSHKLHKPKSAPPKSHDTTTTFSIVPPDVAQVPQFFESHVEAWSQRHVNFSRFASFGIPSDEIPSLLSAFVHQVQAGKLSTPQCQKLFSLERFCTYLREPPPNGALDALDLIYTSTLFTWASLPSSHDFLSSPPYSVSPRTINQISSLSAATSRLHPAEDFPMARSMHRTIIMHVGPTNSGKTHNALRVLAASTKGVYAGPLRLLAHEIWERLNLGQIVPFGIDEPPPLSPAPPSHTELEIGDSGSLSAAQHDTSQTPKHRNKSFNPLYARQTNMLTGEEHKLVGEHANLLSCTVEMLNCTVPCDVAVVDEIQLLSEPQRGGSWTRAVLGLPAREIHLCGEETAIPLVRSILAETGDTLIVNRYERLTPLEVEQNSLEGDFSRIKKGDCIVAFSRSSIFSIKKEIEKCTGLRCAVVYGRLPPEIRSEQAGLFNDPHSGYDVIVGSDAIGMGLNLKIKRVIFETTKKFDGGHFRFLSTSQTKQIAGRAGRYGLHSDTPGGTTTTVLPADLPFLTDAIARPLPTLKHARLGPSKEALGVVGNILPPDASTRTVLDAHYYIAMMPPWARVEETVNPSRLDGQEPCGLIDRWTTTPTPSTVEEMGNDDKGQEEPEIDSTNPKMIPLADRLLLVQSPVPWRDDKAIKLVAKLMKMYKEELTVDYVRATRGTDIMNALHTTERAIQLEDKTDKRKIPDSSTLAKLECLHKTAVIYLWMSYRSPVAWYAFDEVLAIKLRVEAALHWLLEKITKGSPTDRKSKESRAAMNQGNLPLLRRSGEIEYQSRNEMLKRAHTRQKGQQVIPSTRKAGL